jgi:hypothetical protein
VLSEKCKKALGYFKYRDILIRRAILCKLVKKNGKMIFHDFVFG